MSRPPDNTKRGVCGVENPNSKLNPEKVRAIRSSRYLITQEELADIYGVSRSAIAKIQMRKTWKQVKQKGD